LVDQEGHATSGFVLRIVDSVFLGNISAPIAQERKVNTDFVREGGVAECAVHANTQNLGVCGFQLLQILLVSLHFTRSTTGKCKDNEGEGHILLAAKI